MRHGPEPTGSPEEYAFTWLSLILKTTANPGLRGERQERYKQEKKNKLWFEQGEKTKQKEIRERPLVSSPAPAAMLPGYLFQ